MLEDLYRFYNRNVFPKINHIRGTTRFKLILRDLLLRDVEKVNYEDEHDIFSQEWENLIIIDACRQDYWEEETGMEGSRISKASSTYEYIEDYFSKGDYSDFVYVSANPQFSDKQFKELTGRKPEEVFHSIFKTFNTDWDDDAKTVLPKDTIRDGLTARKMFPDKRVIIHFLPPHYPFVREPVTKGGFGSEKSARTESAWDLAEKGKVEQKVVEDAYRDNMRYIYNHILDLAEKLGGKTFLTSDHGNFVGENGVYAHPKNRMEKPVKKVPWTEI